MTRVLIVDDDPLVRAGLRTILDSAEDLQIVGEARNGEEAVRMVPSSRPDVVLMDLHMDIMDGQTATAELMEMSEPPFVLALTTFDVDERIIGVLDAGASGFLLKETPPTELIDAVRDAARGRAVLSPTHTRTLLNRYTRIGAGSRREEALRRLSDLTQGPGKVG